MIFDVAGAMEKGGLGLGAGGGGVVKAEMGDRWGMGDDFGVSGLSAGAEDGDAVEAEPAGGGRR